MIEMSRQKQPPQNISFVHCDITDSDVGELLKDDSAKIALCMYNTIGVIPPSKREQFSGNMRRLAGSDGFALIPAFNWDDFAFAAPRIYRPMKSTVRRIDDDSFDGQRLAFRNSLGYHSQWFTRDQIRELLHPDVAPIPSTCQSMGCPKPSATFLRAGRFENHSGTHFWFAHIYPHHRKCMPKATADFAQSALSCKTPDDIDSTEAEDDDDFEDEDGRPDDG